MFSPWFLLIFICNKRESQSCWFFKVSINLSLNDDQFLFYTYSHNLVDTIFTWSIFASISMSGSSYVLSMWSFFRYHLHIHYNEFLHSHWNKKKGSWNSPEPSFRVLLSFCSSVLFYNLFQCDFAHKKCVTLWFLGWKHVLKNTIKSLTKILFLI